MKNKGVSSHSISKNKQERKVKEGSADNLRHKVSQTIPPDFRKNKVKTEGSLSKSKKHQDKDRGKSIKNSHKERTLKPRVKGSYDMTMTHIQSKDKNVSYSNTDRRRSSLRMHHKTEMNYDEPEDLQAKVAEVRNLLSQLPSPSCGIKELKRHYNSILEVINNTPDSLQSMLLVMHSLYIAPMQEIFDLVLPYENLLLKRSQLEQQVEAQLWRNKQLFEDISLENDERQITRLEGMIEKQRKEIDERRDGTLEYEKLKEISVETEIKRKDFKIDLGILKDNKPIIGYHDEFMSHLPEMSESWRQQALREKRY